MTALQKIARLAVGLVLIAGIVYGLAGRADLPHLWAWLAICSAIMIAAFLTMDPELARERRHPGPGGIDRAMRIYAGLLFVAHLILGALDSGRLHWSDGVPPLLRAAGLAAFAAGMTLVVWAMHTNRFFSPVVRIQSERGHSLVSRGPYEWVRHPGYSGMVLALPGSALALGSWIALVPAMAFVALVVRRASLEDRYLLRHLEGYVDYSALVRRRMVPGLW